MRKLINVFFVAAGLMLVTNIANAQQKFGHLNTDEIYSVMPEAKTAQTALEAFAKKLQGDIEKMGAEYQTKLKAAQEKEKTLSEANKEVVGKELEAARIELENLGKRIQDAQTKGNTAVDEERNRLFPPVGQKLSTAVNSVAKEKGLSYVFDISVSQGFNNLMYFDGGEDITAAVKAKLGISATTPAATKPAATKPKQ
ncbi:MAG: OmpH family outer membrane protein [Bacteroidota bacterium]